MKRYIIALAVIATLFACNQDRKYASTESVALLDSAADINAESKIIKTADMRFRVKDVQKTKEQLSASIKAEGGLVSEFSLQSNIQQSDKVKYSTDSLKEITSYRKEGYLVAKVPSEKLDDFTNKIAKMAVFVDNQSMKMDDQSLNYLANKEKAKNRVEAAEQIKKVATKKSANVESALNIKDDYVEKKIENMSIDNRVKYSTITLNFYQDNTVTTLVVGNDNLYDYRPGFFNRLWLNILNGWVIFKEIILGLANVWMLVVLGLAVFFGIRYFVRKNKLAVAEANQNLINNKHTS